MSGLTLQVKGLDELIKRIDPKKINEKVNSALKSFGVAFERAAKLKAPVDEGRLKQAIFYKAGNLQITIGCTANYAAFVEFGTKFFSAEYVSSLPTEWQAFAAKFRGKGGGSFEQFLQSIYEWVKRKGIKNNQPKITTSRRKKKRTKVDEQKQIAYVIAIDILRHGLKPQPFIYPAANNNLDIITKKLEF